MRHVSRALAVIPKGATDGTFINIVTTIGHSRRKGKKFYRVEYIVLAIENSVVVEMEKEHKTPQPEGDNEIPSVGKIHMNCIIDQDCQTKCLAFKSRPSADNGCAQC